MRSALLALSIVALSCTQTRNSDQAQPTREGTSAPADAKPEEPGFSYPIIELQGRLQEIFTVGSSEYISG